MVNRILGKVAVLALWSRLERKRPAATSERTLWAVASLRVPILGLIFLAIVPLLLGRFWQIKQDADASVALAQQQVKSAAEIAAHEHDELIAKTRSFLSVLVRVPAVRQALVDQCHTLLRDLVRAEASQRRLWVIRPNGTAACGSHSATTDLNVGDRDYFQEAIATRQFVVSDYVRTRVENQPAIVAALPSFDEDGRLEVVALVTLDMDAADFARKRSDGRSNAALMVDAANVVVSWRPESAHPSSTGIVGEKLPEGTLANMIAQRSLAGREGVGPDGVERIWGLARLSAGDGLIAIGVAKSAVLEKAHASLVRSSSATLLIAALAAIAAWFGADLFLLRNIRALAGAANRIGAGETFVRPHLPPSAGEFHLIADALSHMASQISERDAELLKGKLTLAEKTRLLEATLDHMDQGLVMIDDASVVRVCNRRAIELLGLPPDLMLSRPHFKEVTRHQLEIGEFDRETKEFRDFVVSRDFECSYNVYERERPNGTVLEICTVPLPDGGAVLTYSDVTDRKSVERRISHSARHDALTGLPNRLLFRERLQQTLDTARHSDQPFAVLCLDLDRFKAVNDALGHPVGDALLVAVADRIRANLQGEDIVARLGGDEFAILLEPGQPGAAAETARRIVDELAKPFHLLDQHIHVGGSIGIAVWPSDGSGSDELMKNADLALYRAKAEGRAGFRFFEHQMSAQVHARHVLELELRAGLESGQFEVHYQPLVSTRDRTATAFEALVRWRHPERGLILPGEFIPVAEESRLIVQLGHWVLTTACHEAAGWDNRLAVSVNISAAQFAHGLVQSVKSALESSGLPSTRLELEITESVLMADPVASNRVLNELRELGVRLALDDFGTGYSSLSYLRSFPFNKIKIDRSFVRELATNPGALAIVQTIVSLGASLGIPVCAEGIETEGQYEAARALGCSQVQGYLFGRPERAVDALLTLRNAQKRVA